MLTPGDRYSGLDDFTPRRSSRESAFRAAAALAVVVAGFASLVGVVATLIAVSFAAGLIDEKAHSRAFAPGYWESSDGSDWIRLDADGTGEVSISLTSEYPGWCTEWAGPLEYSYTPGGTGTYGTIEFSEVSGAQTSCSVDGLFMWANGWWGGGYNWDELCVPAGDPDVCTEVLARRDG